MPFFNLFSLLLTLLLQPFASLTTAVIIPPSHLLFPQNFTDLYSPLTFLPAECTRITGPPAPPGLKPSKCEEIAQRRCPTIYFEHHIRNRWLWIEGDGCAIAYYFPPEAEIPTWGQCLEVMLSMIERCVMDSRYNAGSVNVRVWPDREQTGEAVVEGEARFLVAPNRIAM